MTDWQTGIDLPDIMATISDQPWAFLLAVLAVIALVKIFASDPTEPRN